MSISLKNRSLISISDYTSEEICHVLDVAEKRFLRRHRVLELVAEQDVVQPIHEGVGGPVVDIHLYLDLGIVAPFLVTDVLRRFPIDQKLELNIGLQIAGTVGVEIHDTRQFRLWRCFLVVFLLGKRGGENQKSGENQ